MDPGRVGKVRGSWGRSASGGIAGALAAADVAPSQGGSLTVLYRLLYKQLSY